MKIKSNLSGLEDQQSMNINQMMKKGTFKNGTQLTVDYKNLLMECYR